MQNYFLNARNDDFHLVRKEYAGRGLLRKNEGVKVVFEDHICNADAILCKVKRAKQKGKIATTEYAITDPVILGLYSEYVNKFSRKKDQNGRFFLQNTKKW